MRHLRPCLVALGVSLVLSACGGEAPQAGASEARPSTFNMSLATVNESGVQGLVTVSPGQDAYTVKLELMGLTGGDTYTASLRAGTCEAPGQEVMALHDATSGSIGIGSSTTSVPKADLQGSDAYHIQASLPDGSPAACGDVPSEQL